MAAVSRVPASVAAASQAGSRSGVSWPKLVHMGARPSSAITLVDAAEPIAPKKSMRSRTGVGRIRTAAGTCTCSPSKVKRSPLMARSSTFHSSANRSRASVMSTPNASYSYFAVPRPSPM